jgi:hypothetical protein
MPLGNQAPTIQRINKKVTSSIEAAFVFAGQLLLPATA